ncbi:MAG TPA: 23S rRNA (adenine(2503)-C(2))-methyltransferase RlmN [Candidatus Binatia bacterium]|nr:23S rRNA (adenine(2503)-C(2))-methyltransferase RlmN [Candidatus Binatia bacterium]
MKPNIKDLSLQEFEGYLTERGLSSYRAKQVWQWLYQKRATSFAAMTNLSASLRAQLDEDFSISRFSVLRRSESRDGTVKFLFGLDDGNAIESVLIPEVKRLTLCISTQAGCGFGCAFCATAAMGLKRNLRASEIVDQVLEAGRSLSADPVGERDPRLTLSSPPSPTGRGKGEGRITHVVLMGMGEPLANYAQTVRALEAISEPTWGIGISPRRITLSTVGLVPQMERLMEETRVNLAVSLHAPSERLRGQLMPVNRKYSLQQLIDGCRSLPLPRRKRITFEYVLLGGVNDSAEHAEQLCELLKGIRCKVNVIPFNPHPGSPFQCPADRETERFQNVLRARGVQVNVRRPRGDDIQAACGQLQGEESRQPRRLEPLLSARAQ